MHLKFLFVGANRAIYSISSRIPSALLFHNLILFVPVQSTDQPRRFYLLFVTEKNQKLIGICK